MVFTQQNLLEINEHLNSIFRIFFTIKLWEKTKQEKLIQKQRNDCARLIQSQWDPIYTELRKAGFEFDDCLEFDYKYPGELQKNAIPIFLKNAEKKLHGSVKEGLYTSIAGSTWLKSEALTNVIDTLFIHFENDKMLFTHCYADDAFESLLKINSDYHGAKSMNDIITMNVRWAIGYALNTLIKHTLVGHQKYKDQLEKIITNKKYRKGRSELVSAYARIGKQDAITCLIKLLDGWDLDVLGRTIDALGRLKAKEAKPHLEKLLKHEDSYFRDLTRKALRKID